MQEVGPWCTLTDITGLVNHDVHIRQQVAQGGGPGGGVLQGQGAPLDRDVLAVNQGLNSGLAQEAAAGILCVYQHVCVCVCTQTCLVSVPTDKRPHSGPAQEAAAGIMCVFGGGDSCVHAYNVYISTYR